jgi:hypothetical protein
VLLLYADLFSFKVSGGVFSPASGGYCTVESSAVGRPYFGKPGSVNTLVVRSGRGRADIDPTRGAGVSVTAALLLRLPTWPTRGRAQCHWR